MFGARYYGSSLGRFMTPDWAAKPTSVPYASFGNPQSLNLYSYVSNNPTTTRDLDGHSDYLWQKFKNKLSGNGWKTDAQVKGWTVAQTAHNHVDSKDWAINGTNTSGKDVGHPQVFKPGSDKCNQYVGDTLAEAGKTRPEIKDKDGNTRMPSAHELADPSVHIPGLSDTKPLSEGTAGDVIAQEHGDVYGHAGIVVGPGRVAHSFAFSANEWGTKMQAARFLLWRRQHRGVGSIVTLHIPTERECVGRPLIGSGEQTEAASEATTSQTTLG